MTTGEHERLERLRELMVLDSEREPLFDRLVRMASAACGVPIALVSLVDAERQWFKAETGLPGVRETPRDVAFCAYAIEGGGVFEVPDATLDPRFADNPLVTGQPDIRFYAGAPLVLPGGERIGTLCVIDRQPRRLSAAQAATLSELAALATDALLMRRQLILRALAARSHHEQELALSESLLRRTGALAGVGGWQQQLANGAITWSAQTRRIHDVAADFEPTLENAIHFYAPEARAEIDAAVQRGIAHGTPWDLELPFTTATGRALWVRAVGEVEFDAGKPVRLLGALQDITERKQLQQQLAANERFVRLVTDSLPVRMAYVDADGRYRFVNQALCERFGLAREQIIGRTLRELVGQIDVVVEAHRAAALAGTAQRFEVEANTPSGRRVFESRLIPDTTPGGVVQGFFSTSTDITALKDRQAEVEQIAFHDGLTGLPNRLLLADRVQQALVLGERHQRSVALCMLDLDGFKAVNDEHGHDAGDAALKEVARRLLHCVRSSDTVARLGGDEFVLLLTPLGHTDDCHAVLQRVLAALHEPLALPGGVVGALSASVGVSLFPEHGKQAAQLMALADAAMYAAKRSGKNRVAFHTPG